MSWSTSIDLLTEEDQVAAEVFPNPPTAIGQRKQFEAAVEAAKIVADRLNRPVRVSLSGHGAQDDGENTGDFISLSATRIHSPQPAPATGDGSGGGEDTGDGSEAQPATE